LERTFVELGSYKNNSNSRDDAARNDGGEEEEEEEGEEEEMDDDVALARALSASRADEERRESLAVARALSAFPRAFPALRMVHLHSCREDKGAKRVLDGLKEAYAAARGVASDVEEEGGGGGGGGERAVVTDSAKKRRRPSSSSPSSPSLQQQEQRSVSAALQPPSLPRTGFIGICRGCAAYRDDYDAPGGGGY